MIPRCEHDNIILGCPHDNCEAQTLYLIEQATAIDEWYRRMEAEAKAIVDAALGDTV